MADYRLSQTGDQVQEILNTATPQSDLTAETNRATLAEQTNANAINQETERATGKEGVLQGLITQLQNDLLNYYLKTETYSAAQIDQMLAAIKQFRYQVVDQLPTPSAETMGIIYLVPSAHAVSSNVKDEFITLTRDEGSGVIYYFEQIGDTAVDLSNYSTTAQMNAAIAAALEAYYTKVQVNALIADFITRSVNDLVNYYTKSQTYTQAEVNALIAAVKQFRYQSVAELPTASADTMGIIYLVPSPNPKQQNAKDEYITISATDQGTTTYSWEQIGTTTVDLSGYYTSQQTDAAITNALNTALASYSTTVEMNAAIASAIAATIADYSTTTQVGAMIATALEAYYTKSQVDALIANFITASVNNLVNYYLKSETYTRAEVQQLIDAVKQFTYVSVAELPTASADTMNKIYLVPSTNPQTKNVKDEFITISATDQGTTTYSWEQIGTTTIDLSGYYTSQQTDAAISAAIGTALADYSTTQQMNAAITAALNTALADYSTTTQMNAAIATAIAAYYTKTEVDALIANFITASVNNLVNYYLKSETYTRAEVQQLIDAVKQFTYVSVAELPTASADTMNKIYLVPSTNPQTKNVKDEFITISATDQGTTTYSWEQIGTTTIDLSGYYTSQQTDAAISAAIGTALADYSTTQQMNAAITAALNTALADYSTTTQMNAAIATAIAAYYTKTEVDALIANFITASVNNLVNYYLKSETYTRAEVQQLIDAVKQFTYVSVAELPTASADTMNKIYLVPSTNPQTKNVKDEFITISVTDQGTTTYSWEQIGTTTIDLSGYYTSQQTDAAITAALNTALADYSTTTQMNAAIATAIAAYYTKTEVDALIANFITASVNNLVNYYLKSETYTKAEVQNLIDAIKQFQYEVVQTLPTASASTVGKIYLVPGAAPSGQNVKDEYITLTTIEEGTTTYSWELIGSTTIDLTNYYTKTQTDAAITAAINTALTAYMTSAQVTTAITQALASYYTKTEMDTALAGKQAAITDGAKIGLGYGTCSTAATTQAKEVLIANFLLMKNMPVSILFTTAINVDNATLNISSTGAKPLYIGGEALKSGTVKAGMTATLIYDGTNWNIVCLERQEQSALWVDMGLPSGVKWAKKNIDVTQANGFAASEYQYECTFYSWGNKAGQNPADASSFTDTWGTGNDTEPYVSSMGAKLTGNIPLSQDTARAALGNPWRMPTTEEFKELFDNIEYLQADGQTVIPTSTTDKRVTVNDITGILIRSVINGNILFFPCSGYGGGTSWVNRGSHGGYWSSSLYSQAYGRRLYFHSGGVGPQVNDGRFNGFAVRAVQ